MSDPSAVEFQHVFKTFGNRKVLDDVSFKISEGEALCIMGRSGTGKSVTLKLMIGLLKPDSGRVCIGSEDVVHSSEEDLSRVRRHMGFLFQSAALLDSFTLGDTLAIPLRRLDKSKSPSEIKRAVASAQGRLSCGERLVAVGVQCCRTLDDDMAPTAPIANSSADCH